MRKWPWSVCDKWNNSPDKFWQIVKLKWRQKNNEYFETIKTKSRVNCQLTSISMKQSNCFLMKMYVSLCILPIILLWHYFQIITMLTIAMTSCFIGRSIYDIMRHGVLPNAASLWPIIILFTMVMKINYFWIV